MAESFFPAEENNERSWYTAGLAGIASGLIKVPEGVFSLGAELIDLGFDTNTAADIEQIFDTLNPFEEVAAERGIGKLTEALVSIGVPGAQGFKLGSSLANKYFQAKKAGTAISSGSKNLVKAKQEAERQRIDAEGKAVANKILSASLTDKILKEKGIEATLELSKSANSKVVVVGSGKDGLPLILGNQ